MNAPSEAVMSAVRRLTDYGAGNEAEVRKTLLRWYPRADPVQVSIIVAHWIDATAAPEVTPSVPIVVAPLSGVVREQLPAVSPDADQMGTAGAEEET